MLDAIDTGAWGEAAGHGLMAGLNALGIIVPGVGAAGRSLGRAGKTNAASANAGPVPLHAASSAEVPPATAKAMVREDRRRGSVPGAPAQRPPAEPTGGSVTPGSVGATSAGPARSLGSLPRSPEIDAGMARLRDEYRRRFGRAMSEPAGSSSLAPEQRLRQMDRDYDMALRQSDPEAWYKRHKDLHDEALANPSLTHVGPGLALRDQVLFFSPATIRHIFQGEINRHGRAVGFHHRPGGQDSAIARIRPETRHPTPPPEGQQDLGLYSAEVQVKAGKGGWRDKAGRTTFFPDDWSPRRIAIECSKALDAYIAKNGMPMPRRFFRAPRTTSFDIRFSVDPTERIGTCRPVM